MYKISSKLVDECWRYSKPKQCHFWAWLRRPIFGVHDSQGSAETLVRRGGIANYHLIAYSFSNISAKKYQNRLMCIEVIACNVSVVFWHTVYNCLEWYKLVLTNLYHDRQLYNTLIPSLRESPVVGLRISRLSGSVQLTHTLYHAIHPL